jgi:hypothetical protein
MVKVPCGVWNRVIRGLLELTLMLNKFISHTIAVILHLRVHMCVAYIYEVPKYTVDHTV